MKNGQIFILKKDIETKLHSCWAIYNGISNSQVSCGSRYNPGINVECFEIFAGEAKLSIPVERVRKNAEIDILKERYLVESSSGEELILRYFGRARNKKR